MLFCFSHFMASLGLATSQRHLALRSSVVGLVSLRLAAPMIFRAITSLFFRVFGPKLLELKPRNTSLTTLLTEQKQELMMFIYMVLPTAFEVGGSAICL